MSWLTAPWAEGIGQRALLELVLLGLAGGALGAWLVLYELSYAAESLAHGMLPGLVVASLAGLPLLLGAAGGLLLGAGAVAGAQRLKGVGADTAVGVVVTTLLGLGVVLALSPDTPAGLSELLFGDVLGVTDGDLALAGALVLVLLGGLWVAHPRLQLVAFDRGAARALGVGPGRVDLLLLVALALALLVAVQGLGNLLVVAVLIAPAAAARRLCERTGSLLAVSAGLAVLGAVGGLELSYHAGIAAGAAVALVLVATYPLAAAVAALRR